MRQAESVQRLVYVGSRYGLETKVLPRYPWVEFYALPIRGIARPGQRPFWALWAFFALVQLPIALAQALYILFKVRPTVIIGFGGYGAFAPLLWGLLFRIPFYLHEQNLVPGVVTRLFAPWAKKVFLTYPQTARYLRARHVIVTGLPIRPEILSARPDHRRFGLRPERKTVLVFGGSKGSRILIEMALQAQRSLDDVQFLIATGEQINPQTFDSSNPSNTLRLLPYIHEMGTALATADLVICRAGAATLAELAAVGKRAIVVPWPGAAHDHQTANATSLAHLGIFSVVTESELTPQRLVEEIKKQSALVLPCRTAAPQHKSTALDFILREVLCDATKEHNTAPLSWDRRRRHEWVGQSLF